LRVSQDSSVDSFSILWFIHYGSLYCQRSLSPKRWDDFFSFRIRVLFDLGGLLPYLSTAPEW
jgi:hypothetical protein